MLSDVMLGKDHSSDVEREESSNSNLARKPESTTSNNFENSNEEMYLNR